MRTDDKEFLRGLGLFAALLYGLVLVIGWIITNGEKIANFLLH